jgi:ABC-type dipeptide/oligopeptide/nickel transport system ATPase subunit
MFKFLKKYKAKKEEKKKVEKIKKFDIAKNHFKVHKEIYGNFDSFIENFRDHSLIMLILGRRGSGKTAIGMKLVETANIFNKKTYVIGFDNSKTPKWIKKSTNISEIPNNSLVLVDEAAISFSARDSMKKANKMLANLLAIARHKNLSLIFITQNSAMLDLNVLRLCDIIIFKEPSLLQTRFERKGIQDMFSKVKAEFKNLENKKNFSYIISDDFEGLICIELPHFWNESISKSFSGK